MVTKQLIEASALVESVKMGGGYGGMASYRVGGGSRSRGSGASLEVRSVASDIENHIGKALKKKKIDVDMDEVYYDAEEGVQAQIKKQMKQIQSDLAWDISTREEEKVKTYKPYYLIFDLNKIKVTISGETAKIQCSVVISEAEGEAVFGGDRARDVKEDYGFEPNLAPYKIAFDIQLKS